MRNALTLGKLGVVLVFALVVAVWAIPALSDKKDAQWLARGQKLFTQHCAACHGVDGKGNGPAA